MRSALNLTKIRLACVPEQVNIPIMMAMEQGLAARAGMDLEVQFVSGGTGKMLEMLESGSTDVAVTVTDALLVAANRHKRPVQMAGVFVTSPLSWAAVAASGTKQSLDALVNMKRHDHGKLRVGISSPGSGSQTMACYLAQQLGLDHQKDLSFHPAGSFQGLRDGVNQGQFDVFLWESFSTQPYISSEELTKLGEVKGPWPAFSFATAAGYRDHAALQVMLFPTLEKTCNQFVEQRAASVRRIVSEFGHTQAQAEQWLNTVHYNEEMHMAINTDSIRQATRSLQHFGLIPEEEPTGSLFAHMAKLF